VLAINRPLLLQYKPDCIVLLDIDPAVGHARTFDAAGDKHEKNPLSFFVRLQE
jgi:thymidylate kinase